MYQLNKNCGIHIESRMVSSKQVITINNIFGNSADKLFFGSNKKLLEKILITNPVPNVYGFWYNFLPESILKSISKIGRAHEEDFFRIFYPNENFFNKEVMGNGAYVKIFPIKGI